MTATAWILALLAALLVFAAIIFNRFVGLGQRRRTAFSDIDVQLKRRWDLVPSLVETVRGYAGHEHEVLTEVTSARARAMALRAASWTASTSLPSTTSPGMS